MRSLVGRGLLDHPARGVYHLVGSPPTCRQRVADAVAAYGPPVAVTRLAAARRWGCEVHAPRSRCPYPVAGPAAAR